MIFSRKSAFALGVMGVACLMAAPAFAHVVVGNRVFVNTDVIDDPGVGDEANFPLYSYQSPDGKTTEVQSNFEYDKTITDKLGFAIGTTWEYLGNDQNDGGKNHAGFEDTYAQLKYRWLTLPEHEFVSSGAITRNFGRAGTSSFDDGYNSTEFSGFFGKGLGDIPFNPIRPFAITGELDYTVPDAGPASGADGNITTWSGGLTVQYSIPYLESQIKDYDLPPLIAKLTPLAELGWTSAAGRTALGPGGHPTTLELGTGAVWTGEYYSFSAEALWPLTGATAQGVGVIGQFHLYFDDLFPNSLGKPIFG